MFNNVLGSVKSSDESVLKHFQVLGRLIQNQTITQRPRLGKQCTSATLSNPNVHTCHFISYREIYNHLLTTITSLEETKSDSKDIQKRLIQYFSTILRGRTQSLSRALIFIIYLIYTYDKFYCDKPKLPSLQHWAQHKRVQEAFKRFWFEIYNHSGNFMKYGHPRTNLMIKSRRDLVYTNGTICETTHSKLAIKWNAQIKALKKGQSPTMYNVPVIPPEFIGTKYTSLIDPHTGTAMDSDQLKDMFEHGWFCLSSHVATTPRYRLPLSAESKNYPEELNHNYYSRDNDNFDVKISSRPGEIELHPDNMSEEDKLSFKTMIKEIFAKEKDSAIGKENYSAFDINDIPLNTDTEEPMPPPNPEQNYVYAGYIVKAGCGGKITHIRSPTSTSQSFSFAVQ